MARTRGAAAMPRPLFWGGSRCCATARRAARRRVLGSALPCAKHLLFLWCAHGGKGSDDRKSFSALSCGRRVFGSALSCAKQLLFRWCAHEARTAKLLRTGQRQSQWNANGGEPGACTPCQRRAACGFTLCQWLIRLRHGPAAKGKAIASPLAERGAVLQGAPRARPKGGALALPLAERCAQTARCRTGL